MRSGAPVRSWIFAFILSAAIQSRAAESVLSVPESPGPFVANTPIAVSQKSEIRNDSASSEHVVAQLRGLAPVQEFLSAPGENLFVYEFDPWPAEKNELPEKDYTFNFSRGPGKGIQQVQLSTSDAGAVPKRVWDDKSGSWFLSGTGKLDWTATVRHTFRFQRPVAAFGVVLRSTADMELRRFYWPGASARNGFPLSYTLTDGTVVQLGQREISGAILPGNSDVFLGVSDSSKRGIVSVDYALRGLAAKQAQGLSIRRIAFVTQGRTSGNAGVADLLMSRDFVPADEIVSGVGGPAGYSVEEFREIAGTHRYVYDQWPSGLKLQQNGKYFLQCDLNGAGKVDQQITLEGVDVPREKKADPVTGLQCTGGEQKFAFERPVWTFGAVCVSTVNEELEIRFTLSDGSILSEVAALIAEKRTFLGVKDHADKGITSVTFRRKNPDLPVCLESIGFALAGPPPGDWKLILNENFDGDSLDPNRWTPGYTFVDIINNELQGYVPENIRVSDGVCTITVEHRDCYNTDRTGRKGILQKFAAGAFTSFDKFTATYGYFEARVRMPHARGAGIWPAFWLLPDRGREYPFDLRRANTTKDFGRGVEIDIFEFMPWWRQADGSFPLHVGCIWSYKRKTKEDQAPRGYGSYALSNNGWGPAELNFREVDTHFHTYGVYWSPERLIWYVDSKPVFRVKDPERVPDVPHYFLFNVAVSLNGWGKSPDKKHPTLEQIIEDMPNSMEIDYFRAYSGRLREAVPASPTDNPELVRKYEPPPEGYVAPAPATAPTVTPVEKGQVPAAPANADIVTPAGG